MTGAQIADAFVTIFENGLRPRAQAAPDIRPARCRPNPHTPRHSRRNLPRNARDAPLKNTALKD